MSNWIKMMKIVLPRDMYTVLETCTLQHWILGLGLNEKVTLDPT